MHTSQVLATLLQHMLGLCLSRARACTPKSPMPGLRCSYIPTVSGQSRAPHSKHSPCSNQAAPSTIPMIPSPAAEQQHAACMCALWQHRPCRRSFKAAPLPLRRPAGTTLERVSDVLHRVTPEAVRESTKEALQALDAHHPGEEGECAS